MQISKMNLMYLIGTRLMEKSLSAKDYEIYNFFGNLFIEEGLKHQSNYSYVNDLDNILDIYINNQYPEILDAEINNISDLVSQLFILEHLKISGFELDYNSATLESVKELVDLGGDIGEYAVIKFAILHKWKIADFLFERGAFVHSDSIIYEMYRTDFDATLYLLKKGATISDLAIYSALKEDNLQAANWFFDQGGSIMGLSVEALACKNKIDSALWALDHGSIITEPDLCPNNYRATEFLKEYMSPIGEAIEIY